MYCACCGGCIEKMKCNGRERCKQNAEGEKTCFTENCSCSSTEISKELFRCEICNVVYGYSEDFWDYYDDTSKRLKLLQDNNRDFFRNIEARKNMAENPLSEDEERFYDSFLRCNVIFKNEFDPIYRNGARLESRDIRSKMYKYAEDFETVNKFTEKWGLK